jgi:hypothetical protein
MLYSNGGGFKINGKEVNSASHATYSHALRNNELWCGVLQEVGWNLQEIMREEYLRYEPEGIPLFGVDLHIHSSFFTNAEDWRQPSPYDNLLETQHEETLKMCTDMKRKYARLEDNVKAVKRERELLYHTIAEFLAGHMPSSAKITTRTQRLETVRDEQSKDRQGDATITRLEGSNESQDYTRTFSHHKANMTLLLQKLHSIQI